MATFGGAMCCGAAILLVGQVVLYLAVLPGDRALPSRMLRPKPNILSIVYRTAALLLSGQPSAWAGQIFSGMSPQGIMLELYATVAQTIF